jgi:hypothetical protein
MSPGTKPHDERPALDLSLREWLGVGLLVTLLIAVAPGIPFRPSSPEVERDYRIPYPLSSRYDLYRRYTTLAASQFPTLLVGDSVIWGQCARRDQTLAHHLNELTKEPRFANAGLDGMHPVALAELLEHHAPGITRTRVLVQFDPLWMILENASIDKQKGTMFNRPDLIPRLATHFKAPFKDMIAVSWSELLSNSSVQSWGERLSDTRVDFLAWSLDHPYESPLEAISATLPPSEDSPHQRLIPWNRESGVLSNEVWGDPDKNAEWKAFERLLILLRYRGNSILAVLGPMNEHMMAPAMREGYQTLKQKMAGKLQAKGFRTFVPSLLPSKYYGDICHPLGQGYEELARELLKKESSWLLGLDKPR